MKYNRLIPELTVTNIDRSKNFYTELLGFEIEYERAEDKFIFLSLEEAQIMIEEFHRDGWNVADMRFPFGRGINFSIEVDEIESIDQNILQRNSPLYRPLMTNKYESNSEEIIQREFLVQDPDGYLLRITQE
ncbi:VOC family protein [Erysipelotrichaceae bacterium RD49]|nr:VOC family protein [Erysipelotrichaceae bacterium RD49]